MNCYIKRLWPDMYLCEILSHMEMWFPTKTRVSCSLNILAWLLLSVFVESMLIKRSIYIVYMEKSLKPMVFTSHQNWYSSIIDSIGTLDCHQSSPSLLYTYKNVIYGFSVSLSPIELEILKRKLGFISAYTTYNNNPIRFHTTYTPQFLNFNSKEGLWPISNYGKNIIIGVIDSGIWPESPSFKDDGMPKYRPRKWNGSCEEGQEFNSSMCNFKLIGAKYFNTALLRDNESIIFSMNSARDTIGHGTYISSIAAGNYVNGVSYFGYAKGIAKGIAPSARLAIYKVVWDEGSHISDVAAGIDSAVADGVDVICLALSAEDDTYFDSPIAIALFDAMVKGIVVSCSAGNKGPDYATIVNGYPWVITVTAGTIDRAFIGSVSLDIGLSLTGWSTYPGNASLQNMLLVYKHPLMSCDSPELLSGAPYGIIVCDPGLIHEQISNITNSSVPGAILISNIRPEYISCACVILGETDGKLLIQYIKSFNASKATLTFHNTITKSSKRAPMVMKFSSRGPSYGFAGMVKPDIMAPGSLVLGAWNPKVSVAKIRSNLSLHSDYYLLSGTSPASAHVAGVIALLKASHPNWSPAAIRSAIMTTANLFDSSHKRILDGKSYRPANPLALGSGFINPNKAVDPGLIYDATPQDYVNLLCSYLSPKKILKITKSRNYSCASPSKNLNYPSFILLYGNSKPQMREFQRTVTNVGKGATTYKVMVKIPNNILVVVSPEILVFQKKNEKLSYNVTVHYEGGAHKRVSSGELVWVEENGEHNVTSPIVVSPSQLID